MKKVIILTSIIMSLATWAAADEIVIPMQLVNEQGAGKNIGVVRAADTAYGLLLTPQLSDLTPGIHGFHVHQHPDCGAIVPAGKPAAAMAAGGHLDPADTETHDGPFGKGHLGDLPALYVGADGQATLPLLAPRLKVADIRGRSLMIHAGGDNYSDVPAKLGGGGVRIACGVIK
jgi:superoxide dismutase, Cu-Zn family